MKNKLILALSLVSGLVMGSSDPRLAQIRGTDDSSVVRFYQPYLVDLTESATYTTANSVSQSKVVIFGENQISLVNTPIFNSNKTKVIGYNNYATKDVTVPQTGSITYTINTDKHICDVKFEYEGKKPTVVVDDTAKTVKFEVTITDNDFGPVVAPMNTTMSSIIHDIKIYIIDKKEDLEFDVTQNNILFKSNNGDFTITSLRDALADVSNKLDNQDFGSMNSDLQMNSKKIYFGSNNSISDNGNNGLMINGKLGTIIEYNGGSLGNWKISSFDINSKDNTATLLIDASINQKVILKHATALDQVWDIVDSSTYSDTYPDTVRVDGIDYYQLVIPLEEGATAEFFMIEVEPVDPWIGLYADKFKIGTKKDDFEIIDIVDLSGQRWQVLGRKVVED